MSLNPVIEKLGRPVRLALIGGGPGSFIGRIHRIAARLDGRYEIVAAVLSSNPDKSRKAGMEIGLSEKRSYPDVETMLTAEKNRTDGADAVAIMTPNISHHPYAVAAMKAGFDVICDKPITNSIEDAEEIAATAEETRRIFCLTHNYSGYPLVRQARAMVEAGEIGDLRLVQVENRLEEVAYRWLPERLAAEIIRQSRYANSNQIRLSHQALADILGTYRETISAILRDFREAGWVKLGYRRITILNRQALENLAGIVRD